MDSILELWSYLPDNIGLMDFTMRKKGVLQLGLQLTIFMCYEW
jgi:hypothetical protein